MKELVWLILAYIKPKANLSSVVELQVEIFRKFPLRTYLIKFDLLQKKNTRNYFLVILLKLK